MGFLETCLRSFFYIQPFYESNRSTPSEMILSLNIFINECQTSDVHQPVQKLKGSASYLRIFISESPARFWKETLACCPQTPGPPNYSREVRNPPPSPSPAGLSVESSATAGGPLAPPSPDHHPSPSRTPLPATPPSSTGTMTIQEQRWEGIIWVGKSRGYEGGISQLNKFGQFVYDPH